MANSPIYTDQLGNQLLLEDDGAYVVVYPSKGDGVHEVEELPFHSGDLRDGVNGVSNELLLVAVIHRLKRLEEKQPSIFNRLTIRLLETAVTYLDAKDKDEKFNVQFEGVKLTEGDINALEVVRWKSVVNGIETVTKGLNTAMTKTYRTGSKIRAVDIKRIKDPRILALFQKHG